MHYKHIRYIYIYIYHIFNTSVSFIYQYVDIFSVFHCFLILKFILTCFSHGWGWEAMAFHGSMWFSETVGGLPCLVPVTDPWGD